MATTKKQFIEKPLIQIDNLIREMTDDEYSAHLQDTANAPVLPMVKE